MLYEMGISHLNLIPYDPALESSGIYRHITCAITPNEEKFVPPYIPQVINFLYCVVSFSTLVKLASILQLDTEEINRNLIQHLHTLAESNGNYHSTYLDSQLKSEMLDLVIRDAAAAIIVVNDKFQPIYTNEQADILLDWVRWVKPPVWMKTRYNY